MLRFDVPPVWSNAVRMEAFITTLVSASALYFQLPWVMGLLLAQGIVRGFIGHYKCPSHRLWAYALEQRQWGGKRENAGAKMFANRILALASAVAVGLATLGNPMWQVPCAVLVVFSTMEWAFGFCAACWAYGLWYKFFPPKMGM